MPDGVGVFIQWGRCKAHAVRRTGVVRFWTNVTMAQQTPQGWKQQLFIIDYNENKTHRSLIHRRSGQCKLSSRETLLTKNGISHCVKIINSIFSSIAFNMVDATTPKLQAEIVFFYLIHKASWIQSDYLHFAGFSKVGETNIKWTIWRMQQPSCFINHNFPFITLNLNINL